MMSEEAIRAKLEELDAAVLLTANSEWFPGRDRDLHLLTGMTVALQGVLEEIPE